MKVPQSVRDLGYQHRRKYKYVELPQLYGNMRLARKMWLEYCRFFHKYADTPFIVPSVTVVLEELHTLFRQHWLNYYGENAEKELQTMHNSDIFQLESWRVAVIIMDYDVPNIDSYRATTLMIDGHVQSFNTGDPVRDYNDALRVAQKSDVDEIRLNDSCQMFAIHSKGRYWYNLAEQLVRVERE